MHEVFESSGSASIHLRLTGDNRKGAATHSHCFLIPGRKSFAVTMCCILGPARKARTLRDLPSF